jgi:hypothetical protein
MSQETKDQPSVGYTHRYCPDENGRCVRGGPEDQCPAFNNASIADLIPQWYEGGTPEQMLDEAFAQIRTLEAGRSDFEQIATALSKTVVNQKVRIKTLLKTPQSATGRCLGVPPEQCALASTQSAIGPTGISIKVDTDAVWVVAEGDGCTGVLNLAVMGTRGPADGPTARAFRAACEQAIKAKNNATDRNVSPK